MREHTGSAQPAQQMVIAALIVISLVLVLAQIRETCVSGHAFGPSAGGELDPPGVHSNLFMVSWWGKRGLNGKTLSLIPFLSLDSSIDSFLPVGFFVCFFLP